MIILKDLASLKPSNQNCTCYLCAAICIHPNKTASDMCGGELVCNECADMVFEDNDQFGMGA